MRNLKLVLVGMLLSSVAFSQGGAQGGICTYTLPTGEEVCYNISAGNKQIAACLQEAVDLFALPVDCSTSPLYGTCASLFTNGQACVWWGAGSCPDLQGYCANLLPIELLDFNGESTKEGNMITWSTASELDNDYFILESSTNGVDFETVVEINGAGSSSETLNYRYLDNNITEKLNYYRLTQVDYNGEREAFDIIAITSSILTIFSTPYPNPSNGSFSINYNGSNNESITAEIVSIEGRTVLSKNVESFNNVISIDTELSKGVYILRLTQGNITEVNNIVIK